jgi:tetratricopeptide (TPR) repeat protein
MMTEKPDIGLISELGELGVTNILTKPLTFDKLSHTIRNLAVSIRSEEYSHYKEAKRLVELGEYGEALTLIKNAESKYTNLKWIILRGRAHLGLHETQSAESDFEQVEMGAHIASVIALKGMVEVYEAKGDTKKTIDSLSKLTLKSPNNVDRRLRLAELFIEDNRSDEAKAVLDSLEEEKRIVAEIRTKVADLLERGGFVEDAAKMRLQMVDSKLDDFVFCNDVAIGLRKQGRYEVADDIYRKIIEGHSKEATLWFNRAVNLAAWGKEEKKDSLLMEAIDHFRMASKLSPDLWEETDRAMQRLKFDIKARKVTQVDLP